ncbi:MAG: hypothetical protein ACQEXE_16360 [Bacillota bacterium]
MPSNLVATVRIALARTVQAIRFSNSAKQIIEQLEGELLPPNPIKPQLYQDAIDSLTDAFTTFQTPPLNVQAPPNPVLPPNPILPNNTVRIKLSDNRAILALDRTNDAIKYIDTAILLSAEPDITGQLVLIRTQLVDAQLSLNAGIDEPPFAVDS